MKYILLLIFGFIAGFFLSRNFSDPKIIENTVTETKVEYRDSLVWRDSVVYKTDTIWQPRYVYTEPPIWEGGDSIRIYDNTVELDSGLNLNYKASVEGVINWIDFTHYDNRPVKYKIVERTKTVTNTLSPGRFYGIGGIRSDRTFNFGAAYLKDRMQYQYSVTPTNEKWIHEVKVGFKIF